jgi:hypothetical protein
VFLGREELRLWAGIIPNDALFSRCGGDSGPNEEFCWLVGILN